MLPGPFGKYRFCLGVVYHRVRICKLVNDALAMATCPTRFLFSRWTLGSLLSVHLRLQIDVLRSGVGCVAFDWCFHAVCAEPISGILVPSQSFVWGFLVFRSTPALAS